MQFYLDCYMPTARPCAPVACSIACVFTLAGLVPTARAVNPVLTHGPVVGGVTASKAKVFVRTDQEASVLLRYGIDPNLDTYLVSDTFQTSSLSDFTKIIPLGSLTAETTYYMNVVVNGVPQSASPPYSSFTTFAPRGTSRTFNFIVLTDFATVKNLTTVRADFRERRSRAARSSRSLAGTLTTGTPKPCRIRGRCSMTSIIRTRPIWGISST